MTEREGQFVQSLANPFYLQELANRGYLDKPDFIDYLAYLAYWTQPQYAKYLQFPQCLHHLALLAQPTFRNAVKDQQFVQDLAGKQLGVWMMGREFDKREKVVVVGKGGTMKEFGGDAVVGVEGEVKGDGEKVEGKVE